MSGGSGVLSSAVAISFLQINRMAASINIFRFKNGGSLNNSRRRISA